MKVVMIDNYDSFTYNLAQYLKELDGVELTIIKNDSFKTESLEKFDKIVISPGPGLPPEAGRTLEVIKEYSGRKPILGICLGLQAIYQAFGGQLSNLMVVQHGVASMVEILDQNDPILMGISSPFQAGRYHSWICKTDTKPVQLSISARDKEGSIMACRHLSHETFGVQFHPESILTPEGKKMIKNFIDLPTQNVGKN